MRARLYPPADATKGIARTRRAVLTKPRTAELASHQKPPADNAPFAVQTLLGQTGFPIELKCLTLAKDSASSRKNTRNQAGSRLISSRIAAYFQAGRREYFVKSIAYRNNHLLPSGIKERFASILAREAYRHIFYS